MWARWATSAPGELASPQPGVARYMPAPRQTLPRDMVIKAMWYVDHKSTHFSTAKDRNGDIFYYFLAKANPGVLSSGIIIRLVGW